MLPMHWSVYKRKATKVQNKRQVKLANEPVSRREWRSLLRHANIVLKMNGMRSIFDLKKLLLVALMLCSFRMLAQQAETNPKLKVLRNEKNPAVRQKKINALKNGSVEDLELLIQYYEKSPAQQDVVVKSLLKKYPQTESAMALRFKSFMSVS